MLIQTNKLVGLALDWAVAKSLGYTPLYPNSPADNLRDAEGLLVHTTELAFSSSWAQGGPIIGREGISLEQFENFPCMAFKGTHVEYKFKSYAPEGMPLIAAMRCLVSSKLGDLIDVPDRLVTKEMQ